MTRVRPKLASLARLAGARAALELLVNQLVQRSLEELGQVSARHRVAQELLGFFELTVELSARSELNQKAVGRERLDSRPRRRRTCLEPGSLLARAGPFTCGEQTSRRFARTRHAQRLDLRRHIRAREPSGDEPLELTPRLAPAQRQERLGVLLGEMLGHAGSNHSLPLAEPTKPRSRPSAMRLVRGCRLRRPRCFPLRACARAQPCKLAPGDALLRKTQVFPLSQTYRGELCDQSSEMPRAPTRQVLESEGTVVAAGRFSANCVENGTNPNLGGSWRPDSFVTENLLKDTSQPQSRPEALILT
jgi:hypothetical protein